MTRLALTTAVLLIAAEWTFGGEPQSKVDDAQSIDSLSKIQIILRKNDHGNTRIAICAGCKRRRPTQSDLVHLKGLPELESVVLTSLREFDDTGLSYLSQLKTVTSLKLPYKHKVTADGNKHLVKLERLQKLDLGYSNLTKLELKELRRQLPNTTIRDRRHPDAEGN